jgi:hypothetical protein
VDRDVPEHWFLGGPSEVEYSNDRQLVHGSPHLFSEQLRSVWENVAAVAAPGAQLIVRFGGIADRKVEPLKILKDSLDGSPWLLTTVKRAGSADSGKRQAIHFATTRNVPKAEHDAWARLRSSGSS